MCFLVQPLWCFMVCAAQGRFGPQYGTKSKSVPLPKECRVLAAHQRLPGDGSLLPRIRHDYDDLLQYLLTAKPVPTSKPVPKCLRNPPSSSLPAITNSCKCSKCQSTHIAAQMQCQKLIHASVVNFGLTRCDCISRISERSVRLHFVSPVHSREDVLMYVYIRYTCICVGL